MKGFFKVALIASVAILALVGGILWYVKFFVESEEFWAYASEKVGFPITGKSQSLSYIPLQLKLNEIHAPQRFEVDRLEADVSGSSVLSLEPDVQIQITGIHLKLPPVEKKEEAEESPPPGALPVIPFRKLRLVVEANDIHLPKKYAEVINRFELRWESLLDATQAPDEIKLDLVEFKTLGLYATGRATAKKDGRIDLIAQLPENKSLIAASIVGFYRLPGNYEAKATFTAKPKRVELPSPIRVELKGKKLTVEGAAQLGASGDITIGKDNWQSAVNWSFDLGETQIDYGEYQKPADMPFKGSGVFNGQKDEWGIANTEIQLANAKSSINLTSSKEKVRIKAGILPFQLKNWMPLLGKLKGDLLPSAPKLKGLLSLESDLTLTEEGPSGSLQAQIGKWEFETASLQPLLEKDVSISGPVFLDGSSNLSFKNGELSKGNSKLDIDLSRIAFSKKGEFLKTASKKKGVWTMSLGGYAQQGKLVFRSLNLRGPERLRLSLKGQVDDFSKLKSKLEIRSADLPTRPLLAMLPGKGASTGRLSLDGKWEGSILKPKESKADIRVRAKKVSFRNETSDLKKISGSLGFSYLENELKTRISQLYVLFQPDRVGRFRPEPIGVSMSGNVHYELKSKKANGTLVLQSGRLDVRPWERMASQSAESSKKTKLNTKESLDIGSQFFPLLPFDLKTSRIEVEANSPKILTENIEFSKAKLKLVMGAAGNNDKTKWVDLGISGGALRGSVDLKTAYHSDSRAGLKAEAKQIDMAELNKVLQKLSKQKEQKLWIFGKGNLNLSGTIALKKGIEGADLKGTSNIVNGGLRILPLPRSTWEKLGKNETLTRFIPALKRQSGLRDQLDQAKVDFTVKGSKMNLKVFGSDRHMDLQSEGTVSLFGKCDMKGRLKIKEREVSSRMIQAMGNSDLDFESRGENWDCGFSPQIDRLLTAAAKHQVTNVIKEKAQKKVEEQGKKILKDIFGR